MPTERNRKRQIFFSSDLHLFHERVIEYSNRPFSSMEEMNKTLIDNWNKTVAKNDIVIFAGDLALTTKANTLKLHESLNGEILIVKGNHDRSGTSLRDCGFRTTDINGKHDYFILDLFEFYTDVFDKILITHYPYYSYRKFFPFEWNGWNISGHVHLPEAVKIQKEHKNINVNCELWDYLPVRLNEIVRVIAEPEDAVVIGE